MLVYSGLGIHPFAARWFAKGIFVLLFLICPLLAVAQADVRWLNAFRGTTLDYNLVRNVITDSAGNIYASGEFTNTVNFDPANPATNLSAQISQRSSSFVVKFSPTGRLQWARPVCGIGDFTRICIDREGTHLFIIGTYSNMAVAGGNVPADFDPGPGYKIIDSFSGVFIAKYDTAGNYNWAKCMRGGSGAEAAGIKADPFGHIIVTGSFKDYLDLDPGPATRNFTTTSEANTYFAKYDTAGNYVWGRQIRALSGGSNFGSALALGKFGQIYIAGEFADADFDPDPLISKPQYANYPPDGYVASYDSAGRYVRVIQIGTPLGYNGNIADKNRVNEIVLDEADNLYATGRFIGLTSFGSGTALDTLSSVGQQDCFIAKYSATAHLNWVRRVGGNAASVEGLGLSVGKGLLRVNGVYTSGVDFDPGPLVEILYNAGGQDAFLSRYDTSGTYDYTLRGGGKSGDFAYANCTGRNGDVYMGGTFNGTAIFQSGTDSVSTTSTNGGTDIFLIAYGSCKEQPVTVEQNGPNLTAKADNATFEWIRCDNGNQIISGATLPYYTASVNGSYAVIAKRGTCKDTSACYSVSGLSVQNAVVPDVIIYPNPATTELHVDNLPVGASVAFYDVYGQAMHVSTITKKNEVVSLLGWANGIYYLRVRSTGDLRTKAFVINKQ